MNEQQEYGIIQNFDYAQQPRFNIDFELAELRQCLNYGNQGEEIEDLYRAIRRFIYRSIKFDELAATVILRDLSLLRMNAPRIADVVQFFLAHNHLSYRQIGIHFGLTKQAIHAIIKKQAEQITWLKTLMQIKGEEDARNQQLRTKQKGEKNDENF